MPPPNVPALFSRSSTSINTHTLSSAEYMPPPHEALLRSNKDAVTVVKLELDVYNAPPLEAAWFLVKVESWMVTCIGDAACKHLAMDATRGGRAPKREVYSQSVQLTVTGSLLLTI